MKKIINKNIIFSLILGVLMCGGIVYGASVYYAKDVEFQSTDASWEVSNVNEAINDLYDMKLSNTADAIVFYELDISLLVTRSRQYRTRTITYTVEESGKYNVVCKLSGGSYYDNVGLYVNDKQYGLPNASWKGNSVIVEAQAGDTIKYTYCTGQYGKTSETDDGAAAMIAIARLN